MLVVGKKPFLSSLLLFVEYGRHMSTATSNESMKGFSMDKVACRNHIAKLTLFSGVSIL